MSITPNWVKTFSKNSNYILYGVSTGVVMGLALSKSQAVIPSIIQSQLLMQNFTMVRVFLSAAVTSILSVQFLIDRKWISAPSPSTDPIGKIVFGSVVLGVGMFYSGACPGTVLAQLGLHFPSAVYTLLGGLAGALTFALISPAVLPLFGESKINLPKIGAKNSIDKVLGVSRRVGAYVTAAGFIGVLGLIEMYKPWQTEVGLSTSLGNFQSMKLFAPVWSPYLSGVVIGLLQIPSFLLMDNGLGCSSGYVVFLGHTLGTKITNNIPYLKSNLANGPRSTWQLFLDVGIVAGAALSFYTAGLHSGTAGGPLLTPSSSFLGGFLLILGARFANGCTSGHGLTGIAKLSVTSLLAVMGMFGGGIGASFLLGK